MSTKSREQVQLDLTWKLKKALHETSAYQDDMLEVLSLGGGVLETLTDAELAMLLRAVSNESMRRQGLMG